MNGNCIFCKISNNQIPSYKIYEDNDFIVILDIHPVNPGHLLCITRQHVESYYDLEDKTYSKLMLLAKKMSLLIKKTVNPAKVTIHTSGIGNKHTPDKTDPRYFETMLENFKLTPEDVVYFEHNLEAVKSAQSLGIISYHYDSDKKDLESLKTFLDNNSA